MATTSQIFDRAAAEFSPLPLKPVPPNHRKWITDAERSPQNPYPPGVVSATSPFCLSAMRRILDHNEIDIRDRLYQAFKHPDFHIHYGLTINEERAQVISMWKHLWSLGVLDGTISRDAPEARRQYDAVMETCGMISHSLNIKMGVHYGLFGGTVRLLGDDQQSKKWMPLIDNLQMLGCFALTELGHGSNARLVETVAEYHVPSRSFVLNTPSQSAQKYWIGGAFRSARWTVCFAQLIVAGVSHGIHQLLVRIRNDDGTSVKGITLGDCGHKCGLNGVDNGRIWFDKVSVPLDHLLRRYSQVSPNGVYSSKIKSPDERFGVSMAALSGGRVSISSGVLYQAKIGLAIAIRYGLSRRAFGPRGGAETRLLDYPLHQYRLIPALATTYVMNLVANKLKEKWHNQELGRELHVWSSGFKALMSWHMQSTLQECREACGGQGYKSENRMGPLRSDFDVTLTFEGDNRILLQTVTKSVLPEFVSGVKNGGVFTGHFSYLNDRESMRRDHFATLDPRSLAFVITAFRRRESSVFSRLAQQIQKMQNAGISALTAFNNSAVLVEEAGRAHTELIILDTFRKCLRELDEEGHHDIVQMLSLCGALYAHKIIDSSNVFLRHGAISPQDGDRVHGLILSLCTELRPYALHLVNAFGIPPHLLAPIAFEYVVHNSRARL